MWVAGTRQNPVKLAFFITSVAFWWYCNNGVANILAGIALFEVFHDVQYLSLVWIYNRNRVEKDSSIGGVFWVFFCCGGSFFWGFFGVVFFFRLFGFFYFTIRVGKLTP